MKSQALRHLTDNSGRLILDNAVVASFERRERFMEAARLLLHICAANTSLNSVRLRRAEVYRIRDFADVGLAVFSFLC